MAGAAASFAKGVQIDPSYSSAQQNLMLALGALRPVALVTSKVEQS